MTNKLNLVFGFNGLIPEQTVSIKDSVKISTLRYVATRVPDGHGVYNRGNTVAFQNAIKVNKVMIDLATDVALEYEYDEETDDKVARVLIPLTDILTGFAVADKLEALEKQADEVFATWSDHRTPKLVKGVRKTGDTTGSTPLDENAVKSASEQAVKIADMLKVATEAKRVADEKAKADAVNAPKETESK